MRIPGRKRRHLRPNLTLKVDIIQARDLVLDPGHARTYHMVAGLALFNGSGRSVSKRTPKCKGTANPVWYSSHRLQLTRRHQSTQQSPTVHIAVFDRHRKYSIYLGELRLSLIDLFETEGKTTYRVLPKWYKLHSSKSQAAFVTGSIKVGFELISKGELERGEDVMRAYQYWRSSVMMMTGRKKAVLDEQFYYSDTDTDVESLMLQEEIQESGMSRLTLDEQPSKMNRQLDVMASPILSSGYDSSDASMADPGTFSTHSTTPKISRHMSRLTGVGYSTIAGVVFLKIDSATGLPPFKRFIQKGFDMDPFVVISCGKKTFRTSWRKHTLTPTFHENLAFEVSSKESHFDLMFNIFDKDHISFHDKVAHGAINIQDIIDRDDFSEFDLKLTLYHEERYSDYQPSLKFSVKFVKYEDLKRELWGSILSKYSNGGDQLDIVQLTSFLEDVNIDQDLDTFYTGKKAIGDALDITEIISTLQSHHIRLDRCPICEKRKHVDQVTHVAICSFRGNKLKSYATAGLASKRWYSKVLIKFAYGKYALGKNNANILVQDRLTGYILEEKMSLYIRLGIRLLYKGKGADSKRIRNLLRSLSMKQGAKFDHPSSVKDIDSFVRFHRLDLSECEKTLDLYTSFNDFFYRKLKPGSRVPESVDDRIVVSPADSRCTAFNSTAQATKLWIKSRQFTIKRLLGLAYAPDFEDAALAVFRLAPQDYHRFHSPVRGTIGSPTYIQGEYYTVNPMAVRSDLDVFGENVRVVVPIDTEQFGKVLVVAVGAMMVGSTVLTVGEGDTVERTSELGYFKFGGSTIIVLFQRGCMAFDSDLVANSEECVETLVRVGMAVGHRSDVREHKRERVDFNKESEEFKLKIIRTITGGDSERPWEYFNMDSDMDDDQEMDEEGTEEDEDDEDDEES